MSSNKSIPVTLFFRKPQPQYFSIEKVFEQVISHLPDTIEPAVYKLKNGTNGWWGRLKALFEVWRHRGKINHITGDITFVALALPRKGLIVTFHDLESMTRYKGWQFTILRYLWVILPVRRAQIITTISEHTRQEIIQWTGVKADKIVVVPNPMPDEIIYTPKVFNMKKPVILVMGTKENKNVEGIFKAVKGICCKLLLVGKMSEEQLMLAKELKIEVENLVHIPYKQVLDAYKQCDLLCFPSFYEGFGLPIIEAQATGRPVITSNFGAMKEVAGNSARLVNPKSVKEIRKAVLDVCENEEIRKELVEKGLKNVERFNPKLISEKYGEIYGLRLTV